MSEPLETAQRTCRFPGCSRPVAPSDGSTGRPPEYCDDATHTRAAAWRARQRLGQETAGRGIEVEERPVDAARQRASEIRGQVAGMGEHLVQQFQALVEELRTVADPDAAEAQLESMSSDAAERVAAASARATRAEQAQRKAEAERGEADAAAAEASEMAEQLEVGLDEIRGQLAVGESNRVRLAAELAQSQSDAGAAHEQAQGELSALRGDLTTNRARLEEAEQDRDTAASRAETATAARVEAEERARGAVARAEAETARAERAEAETVHVREQLDQIRVEHQNLREAVGALRGELAAATAERDGARADVERERTHGDQRVDDLRATHAQQTGQLREDLAQVRAEAREQRSRADRAEAQLPTPPAGATA